MKYLAFALAASIWIIGSVPEANAVVACRAGYYWQAGRCVVIPPVAKPVAQCYWRGGVRICR